MIKQVEQRFAVRDQAPVSSSIDPRHETLNNNHYFETNAAAAAMAHHR